ncbi:MauE/DoxX family redox-associated membrane protein [Parapedobacter sp. 2B3]|uniref:MauE/DoxX family redox-associated membrane protein n=1 Tax=Parapedobacter sp. 2B3 TaxID=3342381 RepID=UPI0035B61930
MNWSNVKATQVRPRIFITAFAYVYLFAYTAHAKFVGHAEFATTLGKSPLIGPEHAHFIAWAIPAAEALLALLLIFPPMMKKALWASMSLMVVFTTYLIYMVASGLPRTCNCGGVIESLTWTQHILFNLILIAVVPITLHWKKIKPLLIKGLRGFKRVFKKLFTNNLYHMLRLTVLGLALGAIAVGNSAYTQKAEANNRMLVTQMWVNTTQNGDYEELDPLSYSEEECENNSEFICALQRTSKDSHITVPSSLTPSQVTYYKGLGLIEDFSENLGIYPIAP